MQIVQYVKNLLLACFKGVAQKFQHHFPGLRGCWKAQFFHFRFQFRPRAEITAKALPEVRQGVCDDDLTQNDSVRHFLPAALRPPVHRPGLTIAHGSNDGRDGIFGNMGQLISQSTGDIGCIQPDSHCEAPRLLQVRYYHTGNYLELQEIEKECIWDK